MAKKYTYDEAVDIVLSLKDQVGVIPDNKVYAKISHIVKLRDLEKALGVRGYAAVNIAALRENRKRNGQPACITFQMQNLWENKNITMAEAIEN